MSRISKSRLLATSAIVGLSIVHLSTAARAQQAFGIQNDQEETLDIIVAEGETVEGDDAGVYAQEGAVEVENDGTIRGNDTGGIVLEQANSIIDNRGAISGSRFGIVTVAHLDAATGQAENLAIDTTIVNSGTIVGEAQDAIRLQGGGTVANSGTISGQGNVQSDGVNMFANDGQDLATYVSSVTNSADGEIFGDRAAIALSSGGSIDNAGMLAGNTMGVLIQNGVGETPVSGSIVNSGTITGNFGAGIVGFGLLEGFAVGNSGAITGIAGDGVYVNTFGQEAVVVDNEADATIEGSESGVHIELGAAAITNAGTIRGNGGNLGFDAPPDAGITLSGGVSNVTNSGTISGNRFGITTASRFNPETGLLENLAVDTTVVNSGTIIGDNDDGVRLIGGGSVTNSGIISGRTEAFADGVSMFAFTDQANENYSALVTNEAEGQVDGNRFGVILSGGGDVANAGAIAGVAGGVYIQGTGLDSEERSGLTASVVNSGSIRGTGDFGGSGGDGYGVGFGSDLESATLDNSGTIDSDFAVGVNAGTLANVVVTNAAGGIITGATSGIYSYANGTLTVDNAGTIRGEGSYDGFDAVPDAGITIGTAGSSVVNSGTISGAGGGITTAYVPGDDGAFVFLAAGTTVENSGAILGESNDGVRLIGGGSVINSGAISGSGQPFADGISMFAYEGQPADEYGALVTNNDGATLIGTRYGVILSGGGDVANAGAIEGGAGGVYVQGTALDSEERSGVTASVVNSGTITGTGDFGGTYTNGYGVGFGSDMSTATLVNSGTISSEFAEGVSHGSLADLTITNADGGVIIGATSGIYSGSSGTLTVDNAGAIRGDGAYDGFDAPPDAGITIGTASSSVTSSGTISGAGAGITTSSVFDEEAGALVGLAVGTEITNSGSILGEANDGVRLIGGGTVTNSGSIRGEGTAFSDGISMYAFTDQANEDFSASVVNAEGGEIEGARFGIILSGGGAVENAGDITGADGGMFIQGTAINTDPGEDRSGLTASVVNSGTITGTRADGLNGYGVGFGSDLSSAALDNSGTISSVAGAGVFHGTLGDVTITNRADGVIEGAAYGVYADGEGKLDLTNAGMIQSAGTGIESTTQTSLVNGGTITGGNGVAAQLSAFDDTVTLKTGSAISGLVDAGDGIDTLTLDGDVLELTEAQQLTAANGFEALDVAAGYWSTSGFVGEFGNVTIDAGASLQVNEVDLGEEGTSSPILTSMVRTDGLLVLNFGEDETVSALDDLTIDGAGQLQLIGEAVFTVDTANIAHTGGTVISNGGLVLTGVLQGDVRTTGDGYFELGAGGTEGSFAGNIVNDGRFVFNRSDNYDFLGDFSGNGVLDKKGEGALTFMGDYAFEGVTNILGGSVRIGGTIDPTTDFNLGEGGTLDITGKDQTIGGLEGEEGSNVELGDSQLTVDQPGNTSFGGDISGTGSFVKQGEGTLNLTGNSTYTGPTSVDGGTLAVNGSIVSPVTVNSGGTLGGNGSVGSTTVGDGGTLAPGNSIGRLTVNGDLAFAAGSTYEVEVNAAGEADRLDATGAVTIDSTASVAVLAEDGEYNGRTDYVILTGADGITGTFGTVTSDLAFLDPLLRYDANSVILSLYRNDIDFADIAIGFNQASVATAVQALGIDNPLYEAVLVQNAATAQASFGDLSGEILASAMSGLTDDSRHLRNSLLGMKAPEESGAFVWGSAFGGWGDFDANRGNFAMDTDHKGLVAGVGFGGNGFAAALSAGIGGSDFRFDGRNDRAEVDSKYLAAHATYGSGEGLRGTVGVSYAWHDVDTSRSISGAPLAQTLTSKRDADTLQIFGEIGYDIVTGNTAITPFARLAHVDTGSDAFTETGGSAALTVGKADQKTTFLSLGARAQFNAGQPGFQPYLSAAWNRAFNDRGAPIVSRFVAGGPAFDILGIAIPKNSAEVEAGFEFTTGAFRLGAAYTGTLASDRSAHGARVTARIAF